jgi:hypothetical protein
MTELSIEDLDTIAGGDTPPGPPGEYWTTPTGPIFVPNNWDPFQVGPKPKPQPQPILFQD